jgi:hypothetical protein
MVYVGQSMETRRWGYQIIDTSDGLMRIIGEEYLFSSPGEVFAMMEGLKAATIGSLKDRDTGSYGYRAIHNGKLLWEEFGWSSTDEVEVFIKDLRTALAEGVRMKPDVFAKGKVMRID